MTPTNPEPTPEPKPKRKRRTKAEIAAERKAEATAEAAKPIDPMVWVILGGFILIIALITLLDPVGFADSGQPQDQSILQFVPLLMIRIFGKTPAVLILTILGGIPFVWGIIGWLRKRFAKTEGVDA